MEGKAKDEIKDLKMVPLNESIYLKPMRLEFKMNGRSKYWDFLRVHDSVAVLIYNTDRQVVVLVKQFRPSMYLGQIPDVKIGSTIDTVKYPVERGYSLELCAGIIDKDKPIEEIAKEEVLEECGYDVPVSSLKHIFTVRSVSVTGTTQNLYYVEVKDIQKVTEGGGLIEEGEFIQVIELSVDQLRSYINQKDVPSPMAFIAAVQWFLYNQVQ